LRGKVIFYNPNEGVGKIITQEGQKYPFSVDGWMDYAVMPSAGIEVVFSLENESAVSIKVGQLDTSKEAQKIDAKDGQRAQKSDSRFIGEDEEKDKKLRDHIVSISADAGIRESMNEYFRDYIEIVERNQEALHSEKKLNFFMLKRFLNTAYHNLKQIDRSISEGKFKEIEAELKFLYKIYGSFVRITSLPSEVAFEMIFLENQSGYKEAQIKIKSLKSELEHARRIERSLKSELEHKEALLKEGNMEPQKASLLESQIKPIRRDYTDAIFEAGRAKEDIVAITKVMDAFKAQYCDEFAKVFKESVIFLKDRLITILNAKAYEFDYILWSNAKESPYIRKFFTECKIEGSYCSKTFLSYYLKSLDKDKLSEENQKLVELLKYLEDNFTKHIIVLAKDLDYAEYIKILVEKIDKDINVIASTSPIDMINFAKKQIVDLVILELDLRLMDGFEFINSFTSQIKTMTEFCIIYDQSMGKIIEKSSKNPTIKQFVKKQTKEVQMMEILRRIV